MLWRLSAQWPLLVLILFYTGSVLLFSSSMLSTSTVMRTIATEACVDVEATPVDQVVLILIDAMRPDFVLSGLRPFARTGGQCDVDGDNSLSTIWAERRYTGPTLRYMENSLRSESDPSIAFFLVADAPTTTAQRIKAIATGTMPAFLEAGSNFNSEAIELDSIVGQMNGSAVLLGDDTWEKLFPNTPARRHWKRAVGIPSFDVADFDTNDDAVLGEMYEVLHAETAEAIATGNNTQKRSTDDGEEGEAKHASLVVAHFLGIDHVGHRIDSDNPFMKGKIMQLDEMLRNVSQVLRERPTTMNTMLLVLGDHGMTNSGDHGGGSAQETDTFLFAQYFPGSLSASSSSPTSSAPSPRASRSMNATVASSPAANLERARRLVRQRWQNGVDAEFDRLRSCHAAAGVPPDQLGATYQVDVTATMALLLGKPIPYSSFGRVIPEILALANATVNIDAVEACNLRQLQRYFAESEMKVPLDAAWTQPTASITQQLADMSYYARRTRTDMHRAGMFIGCTGLLLCAMSLLWSPSIRCYLSLRRSGWLMRWTVLVLVLRLCSVFSNSFVVNEDAELLGLLSSLLLCLWVGRVGVAWSRSSTTSCGTAWMRIAEVLRQPYIAFLAVLLVGLRVGVPVLLRHRAHITHTVETESAMDRFVKAHPILHQERSGIVVAGLLWSVLYPRVMPLPVVGATCAVMACVYHIPVTHHLLPLLCAVAYPYLWKTWSLVCGSAAPHSAGQGLACGPYRYLVLVLWLSSLCNDKIGTAIVVGLYGAALPHLCNALRTEPLLVQSLALHLFAFVAFFAEGHQCMLNTIDWNASFVGMPGYNMYAGGLLVLSRTFHAFMLVPLAAVVAPHVSDGRVRSSVSDDAAAARAKKADDATQSAQKESAMKRTSRKCTYEDDDAAPGGCSATAVMTTVYWYLLVVQSAISCFNGYIQKTHLMLFPIFCPKLLFDAVIALLTSVAVLIAVALS